jgi:hypothetical protein
MARESINNHFAGVMREQSMFMRIVCAKLKNY